MKKRIAQAFCLLIVLFLFISTPFAAEEKSQKADLKGFDEFVTKTMEEWKVTGMGISIVKDGKVIFSKGFGFRNVK